MLIAMLAVVTHVVRIIATVARPLVDKVLSIFYGIFTKGTLVLPAIDDKILLMPATKLAEMIRKKQVKCETVITTYIKRIRQVQPLINAVVDENFGSALREAMAVDKMLANGAKSEAEIARDTPLLGVPFSCKETIGVKGLAQTCGLVYAKDRKARVDADTVSKYRKAGAIPLVVTNVPELCLWWDTYNKVFGATKNPYDNSRLVGGSSGGEGSLLTSAGAVIGIGNDLGGSIRLPCSFCGIYGHKSSRGLISNKGMWPDIFDVVDKFTCTGPMCRYVQDLPLLVKVLAGDNANKVPFDRKVDFRKVRIYYMEEFPGYLLSATKDVKTAVRKAVEHFKEEFHASVTNIKVEELKYAMEIWTCKALEAGEIPVLKTMAGEGKSINLIWELIKNVFGCSEHTLPAIYFGLLGNTQKNEFYYKALRMYEKLSEKFDEILEGEAVLLVPTHPEPPPYHLLDIPKFLNVGYTAIFNILGYSSTQIPAGQSNGVPIGIQAISSQFNDHLSLATAVELDKIFKGWIPPCPVAV